LGAELNVANQANTCIVTVGDGINDAKFLSGGTVDGRDRDQLLGADRYLFRHQHGPAKRGITLPNKLINYNQGGGC
jgi:hypothetical protein